MIIDEDWAHEVGQVRSELGEIDLIYKDFDHIYNRLYDIEDIISDEQRNKIVKSVEKVRSIVVKAEDAFRTITKSPKAPSRKPIKHSTPIGDKKREMQRISTDIARLSVRIRNIGQSVDDFENVPATDIAETFEKASEQLRKVFVQFEKLIPESIQRYNAIMEQMELDEGLKDWAKKAIAGIALAGAAMTATPAQGKVIVKADKGHHELAKKLATVVNQAVGNEYDVQVVQKGKAQQLNIIKGGKVLATVDHIFGKDLQFTQAKIFDKDEANTRGSGGHSPRDMAVMVSQSFEKLATESLDEAKKKKKKLKRLLAPFYGSGNGTSGATIPPFRTNMSNVKLGPSLPGPTGMNAPQYGTLPAGPTAPMVSSIDADWDNCIAENFHLCLVCRGKKSHNGKPCKMCNTEWKSKSVTSVEETMIDGGDKDNTTWFQGFDRGWDL